MGLTRQRMLALAEARDRRYDGRFLTGVLSTGIFCLPSCPARKPKPENVRFFFSPEAASEAGLRACRRCRPELFYQRRDPDLETLEGLVATMRRSPEAFVDVDAAAQAAGFGRSKLHRLTRRHFHASPAGLLQAARVARARELLLTSNLRILDVGFEAGYESDSAFHENFLRAGGLAPGAYREMTRGGAFVLQLPADFNASATWGYLGRDPESVTERVQGDRKAWRVFRHRRAAMAVELERRGRQLRVYLLGERTPSPAAMAALHDQVWRWLGLELEPRAFERRAARREGWSALVQRRRGLRIPQTPTVFEGLVWAIVGQQVNLPFAYRLRRRLIELCRKGTAQGLRAHPTAKEVAALDYRDLTSNQFSRRKAEYAIDVARLVSTGRLDLEGLTRQAVPRAAAALEAVRGVGEWTTQYVLMRACGFSDCVPVGDAGLVSALGRFHDLAERPDPGATRELMEPLAPYRSLATAHLWASLGTEQGDAA